MSAVIDHLERYPNALTVWRLSPGNRRWRMQQRWLRGRAGWAVQEIYYDWQEERFTPLTKTQREALMTELAHHEEPPCGSKWKAI